jgi:hypothetical protein
MAEIYSQAGRWKEAYEALKLGTAESDSINSVILSSSMQGIQEELAVYDAERRAEHTKLYALVAIVVLLALLVAYNVLNGLVVSYLAGRLIGCNLWQQAVYVLGTPFYYLTKLRQKL